VSKYQNLEAAIFSVFGTEEWVAEGIQAVPDNISASFDEYIRISIIPSGSALNTNSLNGILIISIFTASNTGPRRAAVIADALDKYLVYKTFAQAVQFGQSTFQPEGIDKDDITLYASSYTITFNLFGEQ